MKQEVALIERQFQLQAPNNDVGGNSLNTLQMGMSKVLVEMSQSGFVPGETMTNARVSMERLFGDLTALAAQCQQTATSHQVAVPTAPVRMTPQASTSPMVMMVPINAQSMQQCIAQQLMCGGRSLSASMEAAAAVAGMAHAGPNGTGGTL